MACTACHMRFLMLPVSGQATPACHRACPTARPKQGCYTALRLIRLAFLPFQFTLESCPMKHAIAALFCLSAICAEAHEFSKLLKEYKYAEADKAASSKLAQDPKYADALITKAELILNEGDENRLDEALKFAEQCAAAHPKNSICFEVLGSVYSMKAASSGMLSALSNAGKGREALQKAVELDPKNFSARNFLLMFYLQAPGIAGGGMDKAQALQQDTAKQNKDAGNLLLARIAIKEGKLAQAESLTMEATTAGNDELGDMQQALMGAVASQYRDQKKFADSERLLRELIKRAPNGINGFALLGRTLAAQGKHEEALKEYQKALSLRELPALHYRIAQSHQAMGDKARATQGFEKALVQKNGLTKKQREDAEQQLKTLKA